MLISVRGLPYIGVSMTNKVKGELGYFDGCFTCDLYATVVVLGNITTALVAPSVVIVGYIYWLNCGI